MHAKYKVSISNDSKVMAKVKVDNRQTDSQTGQKQYAPNHSIRGHKNGFKVCANQKLCHTHNLVKENYFAHTKIGVVATRISNCLWENIKKT